MYAHVEEQYCKTLLKPLPLVRFNKRNLSKEAFLRGKWGALHFSLFFKEVGPFRKLFASSGLGVVR